MPRLREGQSGEPPLLTADASADGDLPYCLNATLRADEAGVSNARDRNRSQFQGLSELAELDGIPYSTPCVVSATGCQAPRFVSAG
mmetsp:Transcript_50837/g.111303  ORF Transcript_50837/g.111303 Transcript_50837/m.111303 type:complete len:86 (+) Transcript_50837:324-581(+)